MQKLALSLAVALMMLVVPRLSSAHAENLRSWVASYGSGTACTRAAPCADFVTALAATAPGGEINCVDQGDFSSPTSQLLIEKSITIDCEGVQGRLNLAGSGGAVIDVVASPTDVVTLRGLDIGGTGSGFPAYGIFFGGGGALHIEKCVIHDITSSGQGWGIVASTGNNNGQFNETAAELFVSDTVLENNGTASDGGGILVIPVVIAFTKVTLNHVEARNNYFGIKADGTDISGGVINMTVRDSLASGNRSNGIVGTGNANGPAIIMLVERTTSSQNATAGFGVIADGPATTIELTGSTMMGNINGIGASHGGRLVSYQNNNVSLNSVDGSPTSVIAPK
ncbi:MAG: right-handed parallel beta-helix repeat-containing protein [Methylobacteriaceae bacterium]|nr:right-handed parallel beta-helix repeat-containing protein [Methylobacteriaceae bacterium]MBV9243203.1 right-handed parallel beta-helix repeat-containing protein [Methylobacteriaceae bacterium]MBV9703540.1 right-handed parallel beta-helix repeat-containing protein [Methylobacteriaceae bacterium]